MNDIDKYIKIKKIQEYDYIIIVDQKELIAHGHDITKNPKRRHENNKEEKSLQEMTAL